MAVIAVQQQLELTTAWGVNAAYEHHWNQQWQTSVYGGYIERSYNVRLTRCCARINASYRYLPADACWLR